MLEKQTQAPVAVCIYRDGEQDLPSRVAQTACLVVGALHLDTNTGIPDESSRSNAERDRPLLAR